LPFKPPNQFKTQQYLLQHGNELPNNLTLKAANFSRFAAFLFEIF